MSELYDELKNAGIPLDNHESDLYALVTDESRAILKSHGQKAGTFVSQIDGKLWYDIPFHYFPWWVARVGELRARD